ncbi:hypothetical protein [Alicyclobacillus suci]|uniref:hypothetical protein n=1 Tax=Alicyclobacillus suci TaxID=2816080 RepID=UPI001A8DF2D7|nr:hypothetical protein [Alicyclobacillus suci]
MSRKKDIRLWATRFQDDLAELLDFVSTMGRGASDKHKTLIYDAAIIRLYRHFEEFMLNVLVALVNKDNRVFCAEAGVDFPKHLTDEVCEYLITRITGGKYFDFHGRSSLLDLFYKCAGKGHTITLIIKDPMYQTTLDQLTALRNFAAHGSKQSKLAALRVTSQKNMSSSGAWLKTAGRFDALVANLRQLAETIRLSS